MPKWVDVPGEPPSPWREFFAEIGRELTGPVELHCLGGFVVSVVYGFGDVRPTGDVDYSEIIPSTMRAELQELGGPESRLHAKYRVYLQGVNVGICRWNTLRVCRESSPTCTSGCICLHWIRSTWCFQNSVETIPSTSATPSFWLEAIS